MSASEYPIGNLPRKGTEIHLIRWFRGEDSWRNETVIVQYLDATEEEWIVTSRGQKQVLPREEWAIFMK